MRTSGAVRPVHASFFGLMLLLPLVVALREEFIANRLRGRYARSAFAGELGQRRPLRSLRRALGTGSCARWWWCGGAGDESEEEIMVFVPIPADAAVDDVVVNIRQTSLTIGIRGETPVLDGPLWKGIKADESGWVIDQERGQRCIIVTLIKRDVWIDYDYLLKSHAEAAGDSAHRSVQIQIQTQPCSPRCILARCPVEATTEPTRDLERCRHAVRSDLMKIWLLSSLTAASAVASCLRQTGPLLVQVAVRNFTDVPHTGLDARSPAGFPGSGLEAIQPPLALDDRGRVSTLPCLRVMELNQSFDMNARCPAECPYSSLAPDLGFCSAACVRPSSCAAFNPDAPVEDASRGICRGAQVDGCFQPSLDGTDRCITCGAWYDLSPDGQCRARYMWAAWTGLCLVAALACVLVAYVVDLNLRASVNPSGLACGLQSRSMQKYRSGPQRDLWPLTTNLCVTPVGGPGLLLYFNFLAAVIVWSAVIGFGWLIMAYVVDVDLLILGRKEYGTPYRNCVLVAWGFATQQRLMWAKLSFLLGVYIVTFFACLLHGVRQRRLFQQSDVKDTMKAFAVLMKGLPEIRASEAQVEAELSDLVSSLAGQPVVGVSPALPVSISPSSPSAAPLSLDELEELAQLHAASDGDAWLMLVGGEHGGRMRPDYEGTRPGPYLAGHCSLQWVGQVYSRLLPFFGKDRVVVIAQLQETLRWLAEASRNTETAEKLAGRSSLLPMLQQQLIETTESCRQLLSNGGADYDGPDVNPATVLRVLRGDVGDASVPVVPKRGVKSLLLILISHGHAHPAGPDTKHHEWYMHLPYPVPDSEASLYDVVSHEGFRDVDPHPDWDWGAPKHRWRLYSQMLFQAYHAVLEQSPQRRLVVFHQFCLSGGAVDFMRRPSYRRYFGTRFWPVFCVFTAGCFEPALGSFVGIWSEELQRALQSGGFQSLQELQSFAEKRYWEDNSGLKKENDRILALREDGSDHLDAVDGTVGSVGCESGFDGKSGQDMAALSISVCWNFSSQQEQLKALLDKSLPSQATATAGPSQEMESGGLRRAFLWAEKIFLKCLEEEVQTDSVQQLLQKVPSSAEAFAVFETRSSRDIALAALPETVQFRGSSLSFSAARHEPRGIYWQNYSRSSVRAKCWKITKGLFCIAAGLTTWGCIFYLPYVWSVLTFNYEGGRQPGLIYNLCFSVIVVVGNASMYEICARVADNVGFKYKETREACYMILYLVSVSLNIILDLVMTYQMSFAVMVHMGFRTHDGTPLSKLPYFVQRFEAYAIQRAMGQNLYEYAFPSTFLVPFVCEPLVTIYGLLRVGILLVRSHPEMRPMLATQLLSANDFEFGRYADSLLNISLAVMMFFFPGGYTHWIFLMLSVCQVLHPFLEGWRRQADLAQQVLGTMRSSDVKLNVYHCSSVISALEKVHDWQAALQLFLGHDIMLANMVDWHVPPNTLSYNASISACEKCAQWQHALWLLQSMRAAQAEADVISYNSCMSACGKAARWRDAVNLLEELVQRDAPDVISFNAAITACEKSGQWMRALTLLRAMPPNQPNVTTYNATISACEKGSCAEHAFRLLDEMMDLSLPPDVISYSAVVSACEKDWRWQDALQVLTVMGIQQILPNLITFNAAISSCAKAGHWLVALDLFAGMAEAALLADVISYNSLINGFSIVSNWQCALNSLDCMDHQRLAPTAITVNAAMSACDMAGHAALSIRMYESWFQAVAPNEISYAVATKAYETLGDWPKATGVLTAMRQCKIEPSIVCYGSVLQACATAAEQLQTRDLLGVLSGLAVQLCNRIEREKGAYIYLLDHWRILRVVPAATFASMQVDWWCQAMLAPSCGLLAACLVFKGNCQGVGYCMEAQHLILTCVAAGVLHTVVHVLLLLFLVPRLASSSAPVKAALRPCRFEDVAAEEPCTWFSANPVHCLRSKCMNGHSPCSFFVPGQEQMVFSKAKSAKAEDASSFEMQIPDLPRLQGLREMFPQCLSRIVFSS
ncbi:Pentatricopeptide repeat-containing protein, chloroplastic [Symbiodinium microadriaticum]|uniref:Pentatricopeptide repeat-containing protein, chloroplastic n=1 Tax=Symbiodinium microadriaticum TaxID=2951 RepID=A0A1Q9CW73_SYMMI|nr:Pentatricopeptide repeat-containing protein, chloroplastic [Symbiodinium microadriaticum]